MKILHISDVFLRHGGGAPNVIKELAKQQIALGHRVKVATFAHSSDWPLEEELEGIKVMRVLLKSGLLPFYISGYRNFRQLSLKIRATFHPELLHLHMPFTGLAAVSVMPKLPVVYTFHGSWAGEYVLEARGFKRATGLYKLEEILMHWIEKRVLEKAEVIVTLSKFMQSEAKKFAVNPKWGWQIIPAGVDGQKFRVQSIGFNAKFREKLGIGSNRFFILTVRRLAKRMGLEKLIEAMNMVRAKIPEAFLVIGGKGELKESLQSQILELKLKDHVRLEGFISEADLPKYMAAADVFVLPTQALEGFGLIILEAMACGTPVLGSPVGAIPEVVKPFQEEFVLPGVSAKDIANGIINFYNYYRGDERIREAARGYAEHFSWEKMAKGYERVYEKILSSKHEIRRNLKL